MRVTFTEPIEPAASHLRLVDAAGHPVAGTRQRAVGDRQLRLAVPPLPAGDYTLVWEVLARDGHVTRGTIRFTVTAGPGAAPPATGSPPPREAPPSRGGPARRGWAWGLAGAGALVLALLLAKGWSRWRS